jgi:hypothetical protein
MAKTALPETSSMTNTTPTHDEIAAQAYQIYLREGCPEGRDLDHWLQAEIELRNGATGNENGNGNGVHGTTAAPERAERQSGARATRQEASAAFPNSVVPPTAPVAQVTRSTTPRKSSGKREPATVGR